MKKTDITKYVARLPSELHEQIKQAARANGRSMNSEIIRRLAGNEDVVSLTLQLDTREASQALERMLAELKVAGPRGLVPGDV